MDKSWAHTSEALKDFAKILVCKRCGYKPVAPTRFSNCGDFFCKKCVDTESKCHVCNTPVQPNEIHTDHTVENLVRCCDMIAEVIKEDLWTDNPDASFASSTKKFSPKGQSNTKNKLNATPKQVPKNINKRNPKGETPLHTACIKKREDDVKSLLAAGANPNTKDYAKWTPLQEAVSMGYYNICEMLLEAGALPDVPGVDNKTALHEAVINDRVEEVKLLLRYNANVNVFDQYGRKPIDYCSSGEMRKILSTTGHDQTSSDRSFDLNRTFDQSISHGSSKFIVFPSNLKPENKKLLVAIAAKHKIQVVTSFRSQVTHVVVESNNQNITNATYDILLTILHGKWLINSEWFTIAMELDDIFEMELELFELSGAPNPGIPKKARENAEKQNPRLFNRCYFYFAMQAKSSYYVGEVLLTKDSLTRLINEGEGTVLSREPDPEDIKDVGQVSPFHTADNANHPLHRCTHYIIYVPGKEEPRIKYNMPHIKTLPLIWLIECIEKFTLVDPTHLGII